MLFHTGQVTLNVLICWGARTCSAILQENLSRKGSKNCEKNKE